MDRKEKLIQKAAEIIQGQCNEKGYCALTLMDVDNRPNTTTITPSKADGISWITFCTGYGTRTERIQFRPDACVCFNSPEYHISLKGTMEIITDPAVRKEMWYEGMSHHFSGPEDPGYVVLKFIADSYTLFIPVSNEPSAVPAQAFGECREGQCSAACSEVLTDWQTVRGTL